MHRLGRALEEGRLVASPGLLSRAASAAWTAVVAPRMLYRRLELPPGVQVVGVGGATLGGSGKTPLAIACTRELAALGHRVVLVGHAYRAAPGAPRVVQPDDAVSHVGDEALVAARTLAEVTHAEVVVASSRREAIAFAAARASVIVLDGVAQTTPRRLDLSLLAVDADEPWGKVARPPPHGDLRAPVSALIDAADAVIPMAQVIDPGLRPSLTGRRVGLVTAIARPERVVRALRSAGILPVAVYALADHAGPGRAVEEALAACSPELGVLKEQVDLWLVTEKCAASLGDPQELWGSEVRVLNALPEPRLELPLRGMLAAHLGAHKPWSREREEGARDP